jgi:hypothetical protein
MKVYLVGFSWDYEGGKIKDVFRNEKTANLLKDKLKKEERGDDQFVIPLELEEELDFNHEVSI